MLLVPEEFTVDGIREKVRCVADAVGRGPDGEALASSLLDRVAPQHATEVASSAVADDAPAGIVLLGLREGAPVAAGANTSGEGLLTMAGVRNLLSFEGWKPVSVEAMAAARPDFIVIPERGVQMAGGLDALLDHPALRLTPAARERRVIAMDGMAMLGFSPRTVDAAAQLRATLLRDGLLAGSAAGADATVVPAEAGPAAAKSTGAGADE
jgi:iron complex transport system substrate-binding protein